MSWRNFPGPKLRLWGVRIHHGLAGIGVTVLGIALRKAWVICLGLAIALHDWPDREDWFRGRWT